MDILDFIIKNWLLFAALIIVLFLLYGGAITQLIMGIKPVTAFEAIRMMNHDKAILIDVCEANEFNEGHILNAASVPLSNFAARIGELEKHKDKAVILSCRSGNRSGKAAAMLRKNGFQSVYTLTGGLMAWQKENLPIEK